MVVDTIKENLCVNKLVATKKEVILVEGDMIVPDSKPDILNTICTSGVVCIYKKEILEEKSRGRRIPYSFYEKLSKLSCPNRTITAILSGTDNGSEDDNCEDSLTCHETDCTSCWKSYIEETLETLENSDVVVKKFIPDILNNRFIEIYEKVGEGKP